MKTAHKKPPHGTPLLMRSGRRTIAVTLTVIYLMISLSPLAAFAFQPKAAVQVMTGECAGDCRLCKCSPEASAGNTCCCAKKRRQQSKIAKSTQKTDCSKQPEVPAALKKGSCCAKKASEQGDQAITPQEKPDSSQTETVYKCGCPCDSGGMSALFGPEYNEQLPPDIRKGIKTPPPETFYADCSHRLVSRQGEPPVPPPKISISV